MHRWGSSAVVSLGVILGLLIVRAIVHGGLRVARGRNLSALIVVTLFVRLLLWILAHDDLLGPAHPLTTPETMRAVNGVLALWVLILLIQVLEPLLFSWMVPSSKKKVFPSIFREIARGLLIVLAIMGVLKTAFGVSFGHLLTTSAILSAVIGLALQSTLNNILAGITIFLEKPFEVGDWIGIGEREGRVDAMSWRATRLLTRDNDYLVIPNSVLAEGQLVNYSKPARQHREHFRIGVSYVAPPNKVKRVLLAVAREAERDGVLRDPPPEVFLLGYEDFSISYDLRFWINDFLRRGVIQDAVRTRVWYRFKRHGIEIPFPIRDVVVRATSRKDAEERYRQAREQILDAFKRVQILQLLTDQDRELLANEARLEAYGAEEDLVEQGAQGDSFFVILEGTARVLIRNPEGMEVQVATIGKYDYFGEMSLLTGEPRNATVRAIDDCIVAVLDREAFRHLIEANARVLEDLTDMVHARLETNRQRLMEAGKKVEELPPERDKGWVRNTIQTLLGVSILRGLTRKRPGGNVERKGPRGEGGDG